MSHKLLQTCSAALKYGKDGKAPSFDGLMAKHITRAHQMLIRNVMRCFWTSGMNPRQHNTKPDNENHDRRVNAGDPVNTTNKCSDNYNTYSVIVKNQFNRRMLASCDETHDVPIDRWQKTHYILHSWLGNTM